MFGIKHIKFDSMTYVLHHKNGNIKREGRGLWFGATAALTPRKRQCKNERL